ncbi:ras-related protein Rab-28-like [Hyalella azteca]|uniref:Ras-related protein Rab-28-like n=1 Tax=Hyalella azteca TaxID=294128 RepID=A0A979FTW2_HYAAZ|nr:ras-related protein Rab-28-like [Hyalella azteca]
MSDDEAEGVERQVKLAVVGAPNVGKTAIVTRYIHDTFSKSYQASVGVEFYLKRLVLGAEKNVNMQISDVAGVALNGKMTDKYLYGTHAATLLYDFYLLDVLQDWVVVVRKAARHHDRPPLMALVANKADLEHIRQVKSERHHRFAADHNMLSRIVTQVAAELLGVRLTKAEQEQQQPVVKADIITYAEPSHSSALPSTASSSTVCCVM